MGALQRELAERQLALCEASDRRWWFGDYNPATSPAEFDAPFRNHPGQLYRLLGRPLPLPSTSSCAAAHRNSAA